VSLELANRLLSKYHYLGPVRSATAIFGHAEGVTVWGVLRSRALHSSLRLADFSPVELIRMVGVPGHRWAMSSLMAVSLRFLRSRFDCFITYADRQAGHTGKVYLAANWKAFPEDAQPDGYVWRLDGAIVSRKRFFSELGTSQISQVKKKYGYRLSLEPDVPKRRFFYLLERNRETQFLAAAKKKKTWGARRTLNYENH
jgi:hypothetical protein